MKQTLLPLIGLVGAIAIAVYILIFSRQAEIATITDVTDPSPSAETVEVSSPLPVAEENPLPAMEISMTRYTSANDVVEFAYPDYFTVKQSEPECPYCPELVLENEDERLWFGTWPPGATTHCEEIKQHHELPSGDTIVIWYEYVSPDTEECQQTGNIHGYKATVEVDGTAYYIDYLPDPASSVDHQPLFLEIAKTLKVR
ncbi:MAG: hypothetical protein H6773_00140 [Pseudomonadales bacterium]|nr:hypothetical protein [Pseudomonadales bacterium]